MIKPRPTQLQLGYAPPPPAYRRWLRRASIAVLLLVLAAVAARWGPRAWRRVRLSYWQWQCLRYTAPAERVVCNEPGNFLSPPVAFAYESPDPAALSSLLPLLGGPAEGPEGGPVLFMHERRSRDGRRWLVVVRRTPPARRQSFDLPVSFLITVIDPDAPASGPTAQNVGCYDVVPPREGIRFFAGQADPHDASRFVIPYQCADGEHGTIVGLVGEAALFPAVNLEDRGSPSGTSP